MQKKNIYREDQGIFSLFILLFILRYIFLLSMICAITIQITLKYVALEVTRPEKDCFSVREQVFKPFTYPVPNT